MGFGNAGADRLPRCPDFIVMCILNLRGDVRKLQRRSKPKESSWSPSDTCCCTLPLLAHNMSLATTWPKSAQTSLRLLFCHTALALRAYQRLQGNVLPGRRLKAMGDPVAQKICRLVDHAYLALPPDEGLGKLCIWLKRQWAMQVL